MADVSAPPAGRIDGRRFNGRNNGLPMSVRFWSKVSGGQVSECWIWTGAVTSGRGYGQFRVNGRNRGAHRVAYEMLIGGIPEGLELDHLCRNRACVNPWHLDPVTTLVNTRRGAGNASKTHCSQGHPFDDANTRQHKGRRYCVICNRERVKAWRARNRLAAA